MVIPVVNTIGIIILVKFSKSHNNGENKTRTSSQCVCDDPSRNVAAGLLWLSALGPVGVERWTRAVALQCE